MHENLLLIMNARMLSSARKGRNQISLVVPLPEADTAALCVWAVAEDSLVSLVWELQTSTVVFLVFACVLHPEAWRFCLQAHRPAAFDPLSRHALCAIRVRGLDSAAGAAAPFCFRVCTTSLRTGSTQFKVLQ